MCLHHVSKGQECCAAACGPSVCCEDMLCVRRTSDRPYLNLDVPHFGCRANDWPANQCWEDVLWKVRPGIATLDKLKKKKDEKIISLKTKLQTLNTFVVCKKIDMCK